MNRTENYREIRRLLEKLKEINENKLLAVKKYSKSRRRLNIAAGELSRYFPVTQLQDIEYLQRLIEDKIEAIGHYTGIVGGME